jgi:hypothetical protein
MGWQPIETAPKDVWVLVFCPWLSEARIGKFNTQRPGHYGWRVMHSTYKGAAPLYSAQPTHWMPLPAAPTTTPSS